MYTQSLQNVKNQTSVKTEDTAISVALTNDLIAGNLSYWNKYNYKHWY